MIYKVALCECSPINTAVTEGIVRYASTNKLSIKPDSEKAKIIEAEIKKHPTALFFRAKAIKADEPNSNGDYFSQKELLSSYKSFEGVPFFTNHDNQNVENARGKVIHAEWNPEENAVYTISFVDRDAFPHICRSVEEEYITGVSMGAISGGSKILMADSTEKRIEDICSGDMVKSHSGKDSTVKMIHNEYLGKKMYCFDLVTYHKSPMFTNDHPILTIDKEQLQSARVMASSKAQSNKYERNMGRTEEMVGQDGWRDSSYSPDFKMAEKICEGDSFLVPSKFTLKNESSENKDFNYVVGAYLGDGYLKKDKNGKFEAVSFCLGLDEIELADRIVKILKKYSNSEVSSTVCQERNGLYLNFYDRELAKKFYNMVGTGSKDKRIKFNIEKIEDAIGLISGYLDTDGCIVDKTNQNVRGNKFGGMQISSANISLLEDVQSLLIALGCVSRISTNDRVPGKNSVVKVNTTEHTLAIGSNSSSLFIDSIKLANNLTKEAEIRAGKVFITKVNDLNYMVCPVKNVEVVDYDEPVYDLTVDGDESYIADGIAIHNCSVDYSVCNICSNRAEKTEDYCSHIRNRKGRTFSGKAKDVKTGEMKEYNNHPVFEYNYGIKFIELSAVVDPACPSCRIDGIITNTDYLSKVANIQNDLYMIKTAAIQKEASKDEIDQLNQALTTLEEIAVNLIKNRQQVEVDFASDLVKILSELQAFVDELTGAGYGQIPGVSEAPPAGQEVPGAAVPPAPAQEAPATPAPAPAQAGATPASISSTTPAPVGTITGGGGSAPVAPSAPTMPQMPILSFENSKLLRVASVMPNLVALRDKMFDKEEEDMSKRRTLAAKKAQKDDTIKVLSTSWQEKQSFLQYIEKVPSIQNNNNRLSVRRKDDSFIVVAENKQNPSINKVWVYEDLTDGEKEIIKRSPEKASMYFIDAFSSSLNKQKEGESKMTNNIKEAGAKSVNKAPESVQEVQLEEKGLYHSRTNEAIDTVIENQLASDKGTHKRSEQPEVITEKQLEAKRTGEVAEDITEKQLETSEGTSPRTKLDIDSVTQVQLEEGYRTGEEADVTTEKQLDSVSTPWERAASRNTKTFKSASEHMNLVAEAIANSVIETGCTPDEAIKIASSFVESTKSRYDLGNAILQEKGVTEKVNYTERLAFWSGKIKVASVGTKEIALSMISNLRKVASDKTINPEVVISAIDVITEDEAGKQVVSEKIEEKLAAAAEKKEVVSSVKSELRKALSSKKEIRETERKEILASLEEVEETEEVKPDHIIETSFDEIGIVKSAKRDNGFKSAIAAFTKGALSANNMKLASIINVTIDGDTVAIAVQTESGEQSVSIPVGEEMGPTEEETVPEGDMAGEALGQSVGAPVPPPAPATTASSKRMNKIAQMAPGGGLGPTGAPAGGTAAPVGDMGAPATGAPVQALTEEAPKEMQDDIPTAGEQQMPYAICPECGSNDVDIEKGKDGGIAGTCNSCSAEYEALIKKEIEFKIIKPTVSVGEEGVEVPEAAEVPALPVAAQTKLGKGALVRIASNKEKHGHVCPACGMSSCKVASEKAGVTKYTCEACSTDVTKEILVSRKNPDNAYLRVSWDLVPKNTNCEGCEEAKKLFASSVKIGKMMKKASESKFPRANCIEMIAKKYGGNTIATYGPCKGQLLTECITNYLERLGMTKVRHMEKLASVSMEKDPIDECIEDHIKEMQSKEGKKLDEAKREASEICACMKKKYASKNEDNIFLKAFADDIEEGKEKDLSVSDLEAIPSAVDVTEDVEEVPFEDTDLADVDMSKDEVTITIPKETAEQIKDAIEVAEVDVEVDVDETPISSETEAIVPSEETPDMGSATDIEVADEKGEKEMALAMQSHKLRRVGEEVVKVAGKPTLIETIEKDVEAGVPRGKATIGNEGKSNIDVTLNKPKVPRGEATMGNEKSTPNNLPDVPVDNSLMGGEAATQKGTPAINNEIKGTVIAKENKVTKEAKQMKEVETVEKDVKSGVPRSKATIGNEGKDNVDVTLNTPKVPRGEATIGNESAKNINPKMSGPDVPMGDAYMGAEKEVQKGMPANNDEILKVVQQKKDSQLERIANARKMEAIKIASKLLASNRISEEAYGDVVESLASFEIDKISVKAEVMYPAKQKKIASTEETGHSIPAIVMESKEIKTASTEKTLEQKLRDQFTVGSSKFDKDLVRYDLK